MELDSLKEAWKNIDKAKSNDSLLRQEQINELMKKKGSGYIEKIDRNIKIGFFLVLAMLVLSQLSNYIDINSLFPDLGGKVEIPRHMMMGSSIIDLLFVTSFLVFIYKYRALKLKQVSGKGLPIVVRTLIKSLRMFKKQFYFWLAMNLVFCFYSFFNGFHQGWGMGKGETVLQEELRYVLLIGLPICVLLLFVIYRIYKWGFNKLFGQYYLLLKDLGKELKEFES